MGQIEWVPVSDRLPTDDDTANNQILVTFNTGCVAAVPLRMAIMAGKLRDITAWAELPRGYDPGRIDRPQGWPEGGAE